VANTKPQGGEYFFRHSSVLPLGSKLMNLQYIVPFRMIFLPFSKAQLLKLAKFLNS
jgi:hypothetical protein